MIVLGIDPGVASTGYAILEKKRKFKCLTFGVIKTNPNLSFAGRLKKISNQISKLIKKYKPEILGLENTFFFKNLKTALPVSRCEGAILLTAAKKKISVFEFTPLQIKLALTGNGRANKEKIQKKLKKILNLKEIPKPDDAADALAIALTYFLKTN